MWKNTRAKREQKRTLPGRASIATGQVERSEGTHHASLSWTGGVLSLERADSMGAPWKTLKTSSGICAHSLLSSFTSANIAPAILNSLQSFYGLQLLQNNPSAWKHLCPPVLAHEQLIVFQDSTQERPLRLSHSGWPTFAKYRGRSLCPEHLIALTCCQILSILLDCKLFGVLFVLYLEGPVQNLHLNRYLQD